MVNIDLVKGFMVNDIKLNLPVIQGKTYQISFNYPGDITYGELRGQIKTKYAQDNGELLAEFNFLPMIYYIDDNTPWAIPMEYNPNEGKTRIIAQLQADVTSQIPYTKNQGTTGFSNRNCHVYDIEWFYEGIVSTIAMGLVQVLPEVTI